MKKILTILTIFALFVTLTIVKAGDDKTKVTDKKAKSGCCSEMSSTKASMSKADREKMCEGEGPHASMSKAEMEKHHAAMMKEGMTKEDCAKHCDEMKVKKTTPSTKGS